MLRKKNLLAVVIAGVAASASNMAVAEDGGSQLVWVPSIAFQMKELSFDQQYSGNNTNSADFDANIPMLNLGLTVAYSRFYMSLKLEKSVADGYSSTQETDRSSSGESNLIATEFTEVGVGREDKSFTIGYNVWDRLNVFVGYLDGETTLNPEPGCLDPLTLNPVASCSNANRAAVQQSIRYGFESFGIDPVADLERYEQVYTEKGPFIGLSYAWQFSNTGTLSISAAYADMNGKYVDNADDPNNTFPSATMPTESAFQEFHYEGDTTGTSLGLTWTAPLGDNSAYFVDLRRQSYSMEGEDQTGSFLYQGTSLKTDETMLGVSAGLQFYF